MKFIPATNIKGEIMNKRKRATQAQAALCLPKQSSSFDRLFELEVFLS
jgi:hypothetical protein